MHSSFRSPMSFLSVAAPRVSRELANKLGNNIDMAMAGVDLMTNNPFENAMKIVIQMKGCMSLIETCVPCRGSKNRVTEKIVDWTPIC